MTPYTSLQHDVLAATAELVRRGLVHASFGNVSSIDRGSNVFGIKPSGVAYNSLRGEDISIVHLETEQLLAGLRPSSDTPTHVELYRAFDHIGGIAHTHSVYATSWAQAKRPIPCLGTTHADFVNGPIPVTATLTESECGSNYELSTGAAIISALGTSSQEVPAILVASHGAFTWGASAQEAVEHAEALEIIAQLAFQATLIKDDLEPISSALRERHFWRKHGPTAYYGQGDTPDPPLA